MGSGQAAMRIVSPFLKKIVYPTMSKAGLFRRLPAKGLAVVTYHGVIPDGYSQSIPALDGNLVTADTLRGQLRFLKAQLQRCLARRSSGVARTKGKTADACGIAHVRRRSSKLPHRHAAGFD